MVRMQSHTHTHTGWWLASHPHFAQVASGRASVADQGHDKGEAHSQRPGRRCVHLLEMQKYKRLQIKLCMCVCVCVYVRGWDALCVMQEACWCPKNSTRGNLMNSDTTQDESVVCIYRFHSLLFFVPYVCVGLARTVHGISVYAYICRIHCIPNYV
jgi:hypothetical protein